MMKWRRWAPEEHLRGILSEQESLHGDLKDTWELFRRREDGFELSLFFTFTEVN